jgi:hypothetical protein
MRSRRKVGISWISYGTEIEEAHGGGRDLADVTAWRQERLNLEAFSKQVVNVLGAD